MHTHRTNMVYFSLLLLTVFVFYGAFCVCIIVVVVVNRQTIVSYGVSRISWAFFFRVAVFSFRFVSFSILLVKRFIQISMSFQCSNIAGTPAYASLSRELNQVKKMLCFCFLQHLFVRARTPIVKVFSIAKRCFALLLVVGYGIYIFHMPDSTVCMPVGFWNTKSTIGKRLHNFRKNCTIL